MLATIWANTALPLLPALLASYGIRPLDTWGADNDRYVLRAADARYFEGHPHVTIAWHADGWMRVPEHVLAPR